MSAAALQRRRPFVAPAIAALIVFACAAPAAQAIELKLTASDPTPAPAGSGGGDGDLFGIDVAIDGDVAVMAVSPLKRAVYVFKRAGNSWNEVAKLTTSDNAFLEQVAIDGDVIVAGAPVAQTAPDDENEGALYTFSRTGDPDRKETAKLVSSDNASFRLGTDVAINGDTIVAGSPLAASSAGQVYTFGTDCTSVCSQSAILTASDGTPDGNGRSSGDELGSSVDIDENTIVAGAPNAPAGDLQDGDNHGAVYTFSRGGGNRMHTGKLTLSAPGSGYGLGTSVAVNGDTVAAGAPNADPAGDSSEPGALYTFDSSGAPNRQETATLTVADDDSFELGLTVDIDEDEIVAGAESSGRFGKGEVHVFARSGGDRNEIQTITAPDAAGGGFGDHFGFSVAVDGDPLLVGAPNDDLANDIDPDNSGDNEEGSAWIFFSGVAPGCSDGVDNDGDGLIDFPGDPGCEGANDEDETNAAPTPKPACGDGVDNDGDGLIDFPADPGCSGSTDTSELGVEFGPMTIGLDGPKRVEKNTKAKLEVTLGPCPPVNGAPVTLQKKATGKKTRGEAFQAIGSALASGPTCTATFSKKIRRPTQFRALSEATAGYLGATSKSVKVKIR